MGFLINSADSEQRVDVVPPPLQVEIIDTTQSEGWLKSMRRELYNRVIRSISFHKYKGRLFMLLTD